MKNIVIIGGSHGIGHSLATKLAPEANVIILSRTYEDPIANATHYTFDVLNDDINTLDLPETIDGLAYCPGTINLKPFSMLKTETFEEDLQLNFISVVKILKALYSKLKNSNEASIVLFSTVAVKVGMPFHTSVAAAKGALEGFAKALAAEWAPTIRVNTIAPSLTDTPLASRLLGNESKKEKMDARHPLKRVGTTDDIANTAAFLLSNKASWITGQVLGVDGGIGALNLN